MNAVEFLQKLNGGMMLNHAENINDRSCVHRGRFKIIFHQKDHVHNNR